MSREQLDEVLSDASLSDPERHEIWILYPRGHYVGSGGEVHSQASLAARLLDGDVLHHHPDEIPVVERWSSSDNGASWSLDDTSAER